MQKEHGIADDAQNLRNAIRLYIVTCVLSICGCLPPPVRKSATRIHDKYR